MREALARSEERVAALTAELSTSREEVEARLAAREAEIAETLAEVRRLETLRANLEEAKRRLEDDIAAAKEELARARGGRAEAEATARASQEEVLRLTAELSAVRRELARLAEALDAREASLEEERATVVDLRGRLNRALAGKVQELARYRSEFFGRVREVLGNRPDIRIVDDRFVFQSEVLFATASADLGSSGRDAIADLARTLNQIAGEMPQDIDWILRVDGHTDRRPIRGGRFASNWELSTARALAVVRELIDHGIPPQRLAATGFGEFQPVDEREDEVAYRRNRRIEFMLTNR